MEAGAEPGCTWHHHAGAVQRRVAGGSSWCVMEALLQTAAAAPRKTALVEALAAAALLVAYNTVTNIEAQNDGGYIGRNVAVGALLIAGARGRGLTWDELGLDRTGLRSGFRWGSAMASAVGGAVAVSALLGRRRAFGRRMLSDRRADLDDRQLAWQTLVRIPVGTAAFEEVAFRGVVHAMFARAGGWPAALAGSSVTFGLWHIGPTLASLRLNEVAEHPVGPVASAVVATTVAGLAFGVLRDVSGHVLPCWIAHWTSNAVGLLAASHWQRRTPGTTLP